MQGRANADALRRVCPSLHEVIAFDPSDAAWKQFEEEVAAWGFTVERSPSAEAAVRDADIVVTCTPIIKNPQPVIPPHWLKPGATGVALDFDATFQAATVRAADSMWVDDAPQFEYYRHHGHFRDFPSCYEEVAQLVTGAAGRPDPRKRYMVVNLGIALEDMATALPLYHRALERESGTVLCL